VVSHTAINAAVTGRQAGRPFRVKISALENWFGVICSMLWPEEVTERNQAFFTIILKEILHFGVVPNIFFEFLIFT